MEWVKVVLAKPVVLAARVVALDNRVDSAAAAAAVDSAAVGSARQRPVAAWGVAAEAPESSATGPSAAVSRGVKAPSQDRRLDSKAVALARWVTPIPHRCFKGATALNRRLSAAGSKPACRISSAVWPPAWRCRECRTSVRKPAAIAVNSNRVAAREATGVVGNSPPCARYSASVLKCLGGANQPWPRPLPRGWRKAAVWRRCLR